LSFRKKSRGCLNRDRNILMIRCATILERMRIIQLY